MKFGLEDWVIDKIICTISKYEEVQKAVIFGSRAREDYKYNSDIDIALFTSSEKRIKISVLSELEDIDVLYKFDVVEFEKLKDKNLVKNILDQGIVFYEKEVAVK